MKTIQQRLQSRISKRRNAIRFIEEDIATAKATRAIAVGLASIFDSDVNITELNHEIYTNRQIVKAMADDQRLDKRIKQVINTVNDTRRFYDMPEVE